MPLNALYPVRMRSHDEGRAGIDGAARDLALLGCRYERILDAPMKERDDDVGLLGSNPNGIFDDIRSKRSSTRRVFARAVPVGRNAVEAEQGDTRRPDLENSR